MFVPYSSDHCIEYRPWLAYVLFPMVAILSFSFAANDMIPNGWAMYFTFFELSGLVVLAYMVGTLFVLWTFGKAVCAKTGNVLYLVSIALLVAMGTGIINVWGEDTVWILNWVVYCLAGMFLVFCPLNTIDFFIFLPPFRSFSMSGLWSVIVWLIADFLFCVFLGWTLAAFLHWTAFLLGVLLASLYLKIPYVGQDFGDLTLWQWIRGENRNNDLAWKSSWSVKRQEKMRQQQQEDSLLMKEKEFIVHTDIQGPEDTISILCQCGQVVKIPEGLRKTIRCTACKHAVHIPETYDFKE